jgi:hypothetical protein
MASTWSNLKFELIGTGDQSGTWGATTNDNLGIAIEQAIGGKADVTMSSTTITLTLTDTTALQNARALYLNLTGTPGGAATLNVPAVQKAYIVYNNTTGGFAVTVKVSGQTGVSVPNGKSMLLYDNGTDVVDAITHLSSLTLGSALPIASGGTGTTSTTFVNLASNVTGTLPIANGGTGTTSTTFVNLASNVTGTLPIANGGTGTTSTTFVNLASNVIGTLPIANGGTGTTSTTFVNLASNVTGQLPLSNGGTGANLTDPNADRILFWDDSATSVAFLEVGSGLSISGTTLSATASFDTPLTVVGNATAGAEIRLPEDTDNGSNYVALKAPDTLASNLTFTLPSADGSSGQALVTNGSGTLSFGTLGVAGGGTGLSTTTAYGLIAAGTTSTGNFQQVSGTGTSGQVLTSNGAGALPTWQAGASGNVTTSGNNAFTGANTFYNATGQAFAPATTNDGIILQGRAGGSSSYRVTFATATLSANRTLTFPDATDTAAVLGTAQTFTALQTFSGSTSVAATKLANAKEVATISATAATGTINYDITTQSVLYYTSNASANWTVNFRGSSGTSLNTLMSTGESMTVAFLVTQGSTAYYNSAVQVDGSSVTPKYQGGTAWSAGNASSIDAYVYTIVKTGSAAFTVFASQTRFA